MSGMNPSVGRLDSTIFYFLITAYLYIVSIVLLSMENADFLVKVMFWTVLAIMLVILYMLSVVNKSQKHIESIDQNIQKMVRQTLLDEERIIKDLEEGVTPKKRK